MISLTVEDSLETYPKRCAAHQPIRMSNSSRKSVFIFFVCSLLVAESRGEVKHEVPSQNEQRHDNRTSYNFSNFTAYFSLLDDVFNHLSFGHNVSDKCKLETRLLLEKANDGDRNALKILDSVGKPSSGILEGGTSFIGYYSECVKSFINVSTTEKITGRYCFMNVNFTVAEYKKEIPPASWLVLLQKVPSIGMCIPSSCSATDMRLAMSSSLEDNIEGAFIIEDSFTCHENPTGFFKDVGALCISCVFIIVLFIVLAASIIDAIEKNSDYSSNINNISANEKSLSREALCEIKSEQIITKRSILLACLLAFSVMSNAKKIFDVEKGNESIRCLHGLRFLSMALIILGHTFSFATQNLFLRNPGAAGQAPKDFISQIFANGTLAVDTFYFISGLLVTYVTLKTLKKTGGKFPLLSFYFHRYFRLTPLMMMVVFISAYLIRYLGSGPNWLHSIVMYDEWCRKNSWINALYLHNFINTENMCLSHTWYLATDMQFYLVIPLILIPLHKSFTFGAISSFIFLLTSVVTTAVLTAVNHYPAIPYINDKVPMDVVNSYYKNVYIKPYCRIGPYIVGILVGYMLLHKKELVLKKTTVNLLWMLSVATGLFIIYIMWPANKGIIPTDSEAAAYSSLARTIWALTIGWLVIACNYGYGGFVNSILSWTPLVPLSRLTYCAYLIHPVIMNMFYGSLETVFDYSPQLLIYLFLGNICLTFVASFILSLMFESPFVVLEKVIFSRKTSKT